MTTISADDRRADYTSYIGFCISTSEGYDCSVILDVVSCQEVQRLLKESAIENLLRLPGLVQWHDIARLKISDTTFTLTALFSALLATRGLLYLSNATLLS